MKGRRLQLCVLIRFKVQTVMNTSCISIYTETISNQSEIIVHTFTLLNANIHCNIFFLSNKIWAIVSLYLLQISTKIGCQNTCTRWTRTPSRYCVCVQWPSVGVSEEAEYPWCCTNDSAQASSTLKLDVHICPSTCSDCRLASLSCRCNNNPTVTRAPIHPSLPRYQLLCLSLPWWLLWPDTFAFSALCHNMKERGSFLTKHSNAFEMACWR